MVNPVVSSLNTKLFCNKWKYDGSILRLGEKRPVDLMHQGSGQVAFTGLTAQQGCTATGIEEEVLALRHILDVNLGATVHLGKDATSWSAGPIATECLGALAGAGDGGGGPGAIHLAGVRSCRQYRRLMRTPCSAILVRAASVIWTPSVDARIFTIRWISSAS